MKLKCLFPKEQSALRKFFIELYGKKLFFKRSDKNRELKSYILIRRRGGRSWIRLDVKEELA